MLNNKGAVQMLVEGSHKTCLYSGIICKTILYLLLLLVK